MEVEKENSHNQLSKEEVNQFVRQKLKEYTANRVMRFDKRIRERYMHSGKELPKEIESGTLRVFHEFEHVCDKYIGMFELYCERNILNTRIPDTHVTPAESFSDEEKELDRKLEKRKRELLECRRRKNILHIQQRLIDSDFGKAMSRLGAIADSQPVERLRDDIHSLQDSTETIHQAQLLTQELLQSINKEEDHSWEQANQLEPDSINTEWMEGIMDCFDKAGLAYNCLFEETSILLHSL